ncbi:IS66 family insertion sequence element accessory protein TnpA [Anaerosalibacter sp. Marseille-P3206]|uniref:IS66 family insertion sequence element accessory protein TnpA n=1 Tax=Anaerosalibacter sp. Marseille-P3206 TaxID=1871005 RepID=UPI0009864FD6|nr:hypothetical protein [Anaerosalibacter sp. Marseille-P3206]
MTEEERKLWTERIEDYRASGLTAIKWAEENNVSVHTLRYKITQFNKEKEQISKGTQWASVVLEKSVVEKEIYPSLKVTVGKATIEVAKGFDSDTFKDVVRILSQC